MEDVRRVRRLGAEPLPSICFLEFDGDLTDWLIAERIAVPFRSWACFHTTMLSMELEGVKCGIIARTIGGPYAVLIAEQLRAAGVPLIIGVTSAGRIAPDLPLPSVVVATQAIRDEGTSYHYLPAEETASCSTGITLPMVSELSAAGFKVRAGCVWTTDAPYRETNAQIARWSAAGVLAVEMQKYSSSGSRLIFANGRTVIDR